jgi:hypothetical protein
MDVKAPRRSASTTLAWVALTLVLLVPLWWGSHETFTWDSDNLAPGSVLKGLAARFAPGWYSVYGPLPYYLMGAFVLPVLAFFRFTGELGTPVAAYPFGFAHPDLALTWVVMASRLTTVLAALGTTWAMSVRVRRADPRTPGWLVPCLMAGSAQFMFYGRTSNVDVHALFWVVLSLMLIETPRARLWHLAAGAAAAAAAVCSKEMVGPMAAALVAAACVRALLRQGPFGRRLLTATVVGLAAIAAYALLWQLPFNLSGWRAHHEFLFAEALGGRRYPLTPAGLGGLTLESLRYTPLAFGLPVLGGLAVALVRRVSLRGLGLATLVALVFAALFLARVGYVFPRFLLPLMVLLVPVAARGLTDGRWRPTRVAVLVMLALSGGPFVSWLMLTDPRLAAERWIREHVPAGATVEIAGNAHINLRPPAGYRVERVSEKSLFGNARGPVGDVVAVSSIDTVYLVRTPRLRAAWWDVVHAPGGPYRVAARFPRIPAADLLDPMWIAPGITLYQRVTPAADAPPAATGTPAAPTAPPSSATGP